MSASSHGAGRQASSHGKGKVLSEFHVEWPLTGMIKEKEPLGIIWNNSKRLAQANSAKPLPKVTTSQLCFINPSSVFSFHGFFGKERFSREMQSRI